MKHTVGIRVLAGALLLCLAAHAAAMTVGGKALNDKVEVNRSTLVINGAGMRTKFLFDVYIGALYLGTKQHTPEAILADKGAKRIELYMMRHVQAGDFMEAFNKAINENHTPEEYIPISGRLIHFGRIFREVGEVNKGDVILLDYLPETDETVLNIAGKERMRVPGRDFYTALLKIWLGKHPAQESLKKAMLGE
jgi:hypothetical protein